MLTCGLVLQKLSNWAIFFPPRLKGEIYLGFLRQDLPILLEEVPLQIRNCMWLLQDGEPPQLNIDVRQHLNEVFSDRWICRGGYV